MAQSSTIEWTDATWNPVTGCSKVSPGCANCYAETLTARFAGRPGYIEEHRPWTPENAEHNVRLHPERLEQPLSWRKPRMVFVNSMSDLFHELVPDEFIARVFEAMGMGSRHVFQILTKRPERAREWFSAAGRSKEGWITHNGESPVSYGGTGIVLREPWPLPNVWLGVSIENARHTWRADVLREIPATVRFISAEPLLGSLFPQDSSDERAESQTGKRGRARLRPEGGSDDQEPALGARSRAPLDLTGIDWLIVGGESGGRDSRPMHPEWARELRDACAPRCCGQWVQECCGSYLRSGECCGEGVPGCCEEPERGPAFFFKQWGSWAPSWLGGALPGDVCLSDDGTRYDVTEDYVCAPNETDGTWMRYRGAGPKSGGRDLDGRTWDEMPTTGGRDGQATLIAP